mmetsp:Transcript_55615/g.161122  ORF Transcript_55615/g.161122 Transcript_55615/m.161122 type:complete len:333 (+) Transcript_55615:254-1252(+)
MNIILLPGASFSLLKWGLNAPDWMAKGTFFCCKREGAGAAAEAAGAVASVACGAEDCPALVCTASQVPTDGSIWKEAFVGAAALVAGAGEAPEHGAGDGATASGAEAPEHDALAGATGAGASHVPTDGSLWNCDCRAAAGAATVSVVALELSANGSARTASTSASLALSGGIAAFDSGCGASFGVGCGAACGSDSMPAPTFGCAGRATPPSSALLSSFLARNWMGSSGLVRSSACIASVSCNSTLCLRKYSFAALDLVLSFSSEAPAACAFLGPDVSAAVTSTLILSKPSSPQRTDTSRQPSFCGSMSTPQAPTRRKTSILPNFRSPACANL